MKTVQTAAGGMLSKREYPIATSTDIKEGQIVKLSAGLVVKAAAAETTAVIGVAAETHSGAADQLNPRSNGTKIMVWDCPDVIMEQKAPRLTATGGTATTVVGTIAGAADVYNNGYLKLVAKAADSTNTDPIGAVKKITDFATSEGTGTFTVASGGAANAGDVYEVYPPLGFQGGNIDSTDFNKLVLSATNTNLILKVVAHDTALGLIRLMFTKHFLGNGA